MVTTRIARGISFIIKPNLDDSVLLFRKNFYLLEELLYKILNNDTCNFIIMNNIATMIFSI